MGLSKISYTGEHTLNPALFKNNPLFQTVSPAFKDSTDGFSICRSTDVCFYSLQNTFLQSWPVHRVSPWTHLSGAWRALLRVDEWSKHDCWKRGRDIPQVCAKMFIGIVERPAWNFRHKQCMPFFHNATDRISIDNKISHECMHIQWVSTVRHSVKVWGFYKYCIWHSMSVANLLGFNVVLTEKRHNTSQCMLSLACLISAFCKYFVVRHIWIHLREMQLMHSEL